MSNFLLAAQILVSVLLALTILIQTRGTGFGRVWGYGAAQTSFTRRGLEKLVFKATFVLAALFIILSLALLFS